VGNKKTKILYKVRKGSVIVVRCSSRSGVSEEELRRPSVPAVCRVFHINGTGCSIAGKNCCVKL
jgi:hypothetical protein